MWGDGAVTCYVVCDADITGLTVHPNTTRHPPDPRVLSPSAWSSLNIHFMIPSSDSNDNNNRAEPPSDVTSGARMFPCSVTPPTRRGKLGGAVCQSFRDGTMTSSWRWSCKQYNHVLSSHLQCPCFILTPLKSFLYGFMYVKILKHCRIESVDFTITTHCLHSVK